MTTVLVTKTAVVGPLGNSPASLWDALISGRSAIRPVTRFDVDPYESKLAAFIDFSHMDFPKKNTPGSILHTMLNPLWDFLGPVPKDAVLMTATTKGGVDVFERGFRGKPDVADQDILPGNTARIIADKLGIRGGALNLSAACASGSMAICQGAAAISSGLAEVVLICGFDLLTEFVFSGFSCLKILSPEPCRPFDKHRNGLSLGEGAAALLLMSDHRAEKDACASVGKIMGWGMTNDANHITSPSRNGEGLERAVKDAVKMANIRNDQIAAVCAHGTGTVYNDLMELNAFTRIFNASSPPPVFSIKGTTGHTLGASGVIETCVGIQALHEHAAPPTIGFSAPEKGAGGRVFQTPIPIKNGYLLTTNSGFGGINTAVIVSGEVS